MVIIGWERLQILGAMEKKFDEYIYAIIFVIFLIPHFWIPFVGWGVAKEVTVYKNSWTHFQVNFPLNPSTQVEKFYFFSYATTESLVET